MEFFNSFWEIIIQNGLNLIIQEVKMPKITIIGAGSLIFSRQLIWDILSFPKFSDSRIPLMDIDKERRFKADWAL